VISVTATNQIFPCIKPYNAMMRVFAIRPSSERVMIYAVPFKSEQGIVCKPLLTRYANGFNLYVADLRLIKWPPTVDVPYVRSAQIPLQMRYGSDFVSTLTLERQTFLTIILNCFLCSAFPIQLLCQFIRPILRAWYVSVSPSTRLHGWPSLCS